MVPPLRYGRCAMSRLLVLLCLLFGAMPSARAQDPPKTQQQADELATSSLQARLDAAQTDTALSTELKAALVELLGKAVDSAKQRDQDVVARQKFASLAASAPDRLTQRAEDLRRLADTKPGPTGADLPLPELEQGLAAAQREQTDAGKTSADLEQEAARRAERRGAIPKLQADARQVLDAMTPVPTEVPDVDQRLLAARRLAQAAERVHLQAQIDALAAELQSYDAETDLQRTERDLAARRAAVAKASADAWLAALQPARAAAAARAEQDAKQAQQQAVASDARIQKLAAGNAELAAELSRMVERRDLVEHEKSERDAELLRYTQDFQEVKKKAQLAGASDLVGALLRQRRASMASTSRQNQQRTRDRSERVAVAQYKSIEFEERRARLVEDPETWLQQELGGAVTTEALPASVLAEALRLRDARQDLLTQLASGYSALLTTQLDVAGSEGALADLLAKYRTFVTERVLGIRSAEPLWHFDLAAAGEATAWLVRDTSWRATAHTVFATATAEIWPLAALFVCLLLFAGRFVLLRRLATHGERALRGSNVAYSPTILALVDTVLLAVPLPAIAWLLGWCLSASEETAEFGKAVGAGAVQAALGLFLALSLRALSRPKGLAEAHFRWQSTTLARLRSVLPLLLLAVPFAFGIGMLEVASDDRWLGTLGALLLLAQLALLTIVFWRLLHPRTGIVAAGVGAEQTTLYRFRRLWFLLGTGVPIVLFAMVVLGYQYTALQLARRLQTTAAAVLLGVLLHALILRGLVLERRRLQMRRAKERLAAQQAGDSGEAVAAAEAAHAAVDPQSLARQTQTLLRGVIAIAVAIAAYQIWVDVLPALGALRNVTLWDSGTQAAPAMVTLADLLLGVFILLAAIVAARNLPALLELLVLQRLRMQPGERHAIKTLATYFFFFIGIGIAFASIDIGWSKVQWLFAAVSVGLGFGLQEIFANFVSGLILLFEQPVRVGDLVTVGTINGRVTRIRIRATTIQDFDRKELIVPNREFVTSSFVNWTLSDSVVRWTIPVGVAYGSDTQQALKLLAEVAKASRFVLHEPAPETVMVGFGDSSLDLSLRVYVDQNSLEVPWLTELLQGIDKTFAAAGIEMAFPQRDVNLKLGEPLMEILRRTPGTRAASG